MDTFYGLVGLGGGIFWLDRDGCQVFTSESGERIPGAGWTFFMPEW